MPGSPFYGVSVMCWNIRVRRARMEKEGFWGKGERRLYHNYFTPRELETLFREAGVREIRLRGLLLIPGKIAHRFPTSSSIVENWCSRIPTLARIGLLLLAIGRRP